MSRFNLNRHQVPDANTEFGKLSLNFDRLAPEDLTTDQLERLNFLARQLLIVARATHSEDKLDFASAAFRTVHTEINRRELGLTRKK